MCIQFIYINTFSYFSIFTYSINIIFFVRPPIFVSLPQRKETPEIPSSSSSWPYPCLGIESTLWMGSKYISLPPQGSPNGCVGCLVPVSGPCGRICRGGLLVWGLALSSFSPSSPLLVVRWPPAPSEKTLSL